MTARLTDAPVPLEDYVPTADRFVALSGDWGTYEALLAARGEHSSPRIAYLDGVLQLMSPSREHETIKSSLGDIVKAYCVEKRIGYTGAGSWTLKEQLQKAGVEPDDCFLFGNDPRSKHRPDLAIEVIWTSGGISKLEIYRRLEVPEVWFWEKGVITPYILVADNYVAAERSASLPELDLSLICRFVAVTPTSTAVVQFLEVIRGQVGE